MANAQQQKKKAAAPVIPIILILVAVAGLAAGAWLLLAQSDVFGGGQDDRQHTITMQLGEQKTLEVPFADDFTCTSSDEKIVSFDPETNLLTANAAGQATLVAKSSSGSKSELYLITVVANENTGSTQDTTTTSATEVTTTETETTSTEETTLPPGSVTGISLSYYSATVKVGERYIYSLVTMSPPDATDKGEDWSSDDESVATVDQYGYITGVSAGECTVRVASVNNPNVFAEIAVTVVAEETATSAADSTADGTGTTTSTSSSASADNTANNSTSDRSDIQVINGITYVQGVMIANKTYSLPSTYNPGVQPEAQSAFNEMQAAAAAEGLSMTIVSGFRSYSTQQTLYNKYVARDGKAAADRYSARAGHSEHQTGLAFDINNASSAFTNTPEAKWLAENCWKYGFILRYPEGKESVTGYMYESWHVRYLGKEWAKKIYDSGLTLEEYFGITSAYAE